MGYQWIASNYNDSDLTENNIRDGVEIFGVEGGLVGTNWLDIIKNITIDNPAGSTVIVPNSVWHYEYWDKIYMFYMDLQSPTAKVVLLSIDKTTWELSQESVWNITNTSPFITVYSAYVDWNNIYINWQQSSDQKHFIYDMDTWTRTLWFVSAGIDGWYTSWTLLDNIYPCVYSGIEYNTARISNWIGLYNAPMLDIDFNP